MINLRGRDLNAMVEQLRAAKIDVSIVGDGTTEKSQKLVESKNIGLVSNPDELVPEAHFVNSRPFSMCFRREWAKVAAIFKGRCREDAGGHGRQFSPESTKQSLANCPD
jgi:hypothetical protein